MGQKRKLIETGVDKLVSIVNEKGEISFKDAAKKLATPISSIEEWAKFLEEEDVIEINYKLATPYLRKKQLTQVQKRQKIDNFKKSKEIFDNKLEAATSYFNELDKKINNVTKMFQDVEGHLSSKLGKVEEEISLLRDAEKQKENLDEQILEAKRRSLNKIKEIEDHTRKEKISYERAFSQAKQELRKDDDLLKKSENFLQKVKDEENYLQKRLKEVQEMSKKIQDEVEVRSKMLADTEEHIIMVKKKHDLLKDDLESEQVVLKRMIDENEEQEKLIGELQKTIIAKMDEGEKRLDAKEKEIRDIPKRFKEMIEHKKDIKDLLNVITHEEIELKEEITELRRQSRILSLSIGTKDFGKEIDKLNLRISDITSKRAFFKEKVTKLIKLLDWKK
jgi:chromosome segregation ATPase